VRFFFDNNLPPPIAKALDALTSAEGHSVVHLRDRFPPDVTDVEWLTTRGQEGNWIIVSGDLRIIENRHERAAWLEGKLTAFFLKPGWMNQPLWIQAWHLIRWWPKIVDQARKVHPGAGFLVPMKGQKFEQPVMKT
jgi:PIN like domain